eukprot:3939433-Rhodomonas_salina.2
MPAVDKVNDALREFVSPELKGIYGESRVRYVDCGSPFRTNGGPENKEEVPSCSLSICGVAIARFGSDTLHAVPR